MKRIRLLSLNKSTLVVLYNLCSKSSNSLKRLSLDHPCFNKHHYHYHSHRHSHSHSHYIIVIVILIVVLTIILIIIVIIIVIVIVNASYLRWGRCRGVLCHFQNISCTRKPKQKIVREMARTCKKSYLCSIL